MTSAASCLLLLALTMGPALADEERDHAIARTEPIPGALVDAGDKVSAHLVSEDGDGKVVGRASLDFREKWTLGLEVTSPFDKKTDQEAELISIDSLGAGSTARLFLTFDDFKSKDNIAAIGDTVCDHLAAEALRVATAKRAVQRPREELVSRGCPAGMVKGQWYRPDLAPGAPQPCDLKMLQCVGGDFDVRAADALEKVCLDANKLLLADLFHARRFASDTLSATPYVEPCPETVADLDRELRDRVTASRATAKASAADGVWGSAAKVKAWVDEQVAAAVAPICSEYTTFDVAVLYPGGGGACVQSDAEAFIAERAAAAPDEDWDRFRSQVRTMRVHREWLVSAHYETAKPTFKYFDLTTSKEIEQHERPYNVGLSVGYFTGRTLYGLDVSRIRRFKAAAKEEVCVPSTTAGSLRCLTSPLNGPAEREFDLVSLRARRFLSRSERFAGIAELKYSSDDDALEPHLVLYALQHIVDNKVEGLNGGLDVGYNTETHDPIFRVFIGSTFSLDG